MGDVHARETFVGKSERKGPSERPRLRKEV
jgi:hypothetical protein